MKMDWFVILFTASVIGMVLFEGYAIYKVRTLRTETGETIRWDWSWFVYPWISVLIVVALAWSDWGILS